MLLLASALAFLSGFVALGYEVLWARRLSDVIGATALASSLVVGVFFVMLSAGAWALGPRAARSRSPWRLYALLEACILVAILPAFYGESLAGAVAAAFGDALLRPGSGLALKSLLAVLFVGPASFCMGGTLPAMGQAVVRAGQLGRDGNRLYGINTLGGAAGVVVTTFVLAPRFGMHGAFFVLMAASLALAIAALRIARTASAASIPRSQTSLLAPGAQSTALVTHGAAVGPQDSAAIWTALAFFSGANVLGLEILALHLFGQVLHNSTYTFAAVLVVVIASLAAGALIVQQWRLDHGTAVHRAGLVLLATALASALVPRAFFALTHGMQPFGGGVASLAGYVLRIAGVGTLVLGPVFALAGTVFPLALAGAGLTASNSKRAASEVGACWGRLLAANAVGALLGLLLADFVCMRALGLWITLSLWALAACVAGMLVAMRGPAAGRHARLAFAAAAALALVAGFPGSLPVAALQPGDTLLSWQAGADGIAAAIARRPESANEAPDIRIKWNNTYSLGGTGNAAQQARMGHIPLLLHPAPRRVGFIGLATGITASAALRDPAVHSVVAAELSPEITTLACRHFAAANADLCNDAKVRVVVEDGRLFFRATRDTFDVVVGDLFVPWQAGTANLYTREQFTAVREHLAPGGLFAQWLPVFQLDPVGFFGIASTFASVFPNAWLAVADFQPYNPAIALIGWRDAEGAPAFDVVTSRCEQVQPGTRLREPMLADAAGVGTFLVGPLAGQLPPGVPLLTLDNPWLADHAPRIQRTRPPQWFVGASLARYLQHVARAAPQDRFAPAIARGQDLYQFAELVDREGLESARQWFEANVHSPLPAANFAIDHPELVRWPFTMQTGLYLVRHALAEARTAAALPALAPPPRVR